MPGEPGDVVGRVLVAEVVQQQERVELLGFAETEGALQLDAGALDGRDGFSNVLHSTKGHDDLHLGLQVLDSRRRYSLQQLSPGVSVAIPRATLMIRSNQCAPEARRPGRVSFQKNHGSLRFLLDQRWESV